MLTVGTYLADRYEIVSKIGAGGMSDVYKAKDHVLGRFVAIKVLKPEFSEDRGFVAKFRTEAQSAAGLEHPNIVNIYDVGSEEGLHYIVMEYVEGITLKTYIEKKGQLSFKEAVSIAIQVARGIEAAHNKQIIHRDIKPQNIMISTEGKVKVMDFGIARAASSNTVSSDVMGSVHYSSPEQARNGFVDGRSDIYSLGITIYEMATGKVPFDGENTVAIALMHLRDEITPPRCYFPDIPASLEKIILKCTMKQPEQRYQSAAELILDLQKVFLSPDGSYVYVNPLVDDSPTIQRNKEDITKIRKSLNKSGNRRKEDNTKDRIRINEENEDDEDYKDDKEMNPKLEKMILLITVLFGVLVACVVFYFIGNSLHLFQPSSGTTQQSTEQTTQDRTKATTTEEKKTEYVKMPKLLDLTKNAAEDEMKAIGLKADFAYEKGSSSDDSDLIVVKQQYKKGESLAVGTKVKLTLGKKESSTTAAEKVEVPALVNYTEKKAEQELKKLGLKVKKAYANSDTVKEGYVIKQSPKGGSIVNTGFAVTITISKGVSKTTVPSLIGVSQSVAERELNRVGLKLGSVSYDYSGEVGEGDVISQGIESGTSVDKGTNYPLIHKTFLPFLRDDY